MCSVTPLMPGQNPFCMLVSIRELDMRKSQILLRMQELKIFPITGWRAIGLKFCGSDVSPFLWMRVTVALRQIFGKYCLIQHAERRLVRCVLKIGHRLKIIMLIASSGEGQLRAFIALTTLLTSLKVGGGVGGGNEEKGGERGFFRKPGECSKK